MNKTIIAGLVALGLTATAALAQTTAFTYQGRLNSDSGPVTGLYDFTFVLHDAAAADGQVGNSLTNVAVPVTSGLFNVALDFGAGSFTGADRWLQIAVRTNGAGEFSVLLPRQPITSVPYAITAGHLNGPLSAANLTGTIALAQLPAAVVTNNQSGANLAGSFVGDGGGLTNLSVPATSLTGTLPDARLSSSVPLLNGTNAFTGSNNFAGLVTAANPGNAFRGTLTGNVVGDVTGNVTGSAATANTFAGSLSGDVTGTQSATTVANVGGQTAANVAGGASAANAATSANTPNTIVKRDGSGSFSAGAVAATSFSGNGSELTGLDGANLVNGSVAAAKLGSGAALANLNASGQSGVPTGGMLLSSNYTDANLINAGYVRLGVAGLGELWQGRPSPGSLAGRIDHSAVWTGTEMIFWGGQGAPGGSAYFNDGARYNPTLNTWTAITTNGAPSARHYHAAVWTGTEMIVWGGQNATIWPGGGARYNPVNDTWTTISAASAPAARSYHVAVWTGTEMIVWGGKDASVHFNDGGRYNPVNDTWTAVSTIGAPAAGRRGHASVWTGSEMIVWGGYTVASTTLNDGGRYNPLSNSWTATSTSGAPGARAYSGAVWTGSEMIVWGGISGNPLNSGGRYNPANNSWTTVTTAGAPAEGRYVHSAVWTGTEMIVWGGLGLGNITPNNGGRYNPLGDNWAATPIIGAPAGRFSHRAVWTGSEMLVFGGAIASGTYFNDTFSYAPPRTVYLYTRP